MSKVMPLPMSPRLFSGVLRVAVVGQDDELGRFVGALGHSYEGTHAPFLHIGVVHDLEAQPVFFGHPAGGLSHCAGSHGIGWLIDHVAGDHGGLSHRAALGHPAPYSLGALFVALGYGQLGELAVGGFAVGVIAVEAIESQQRAFGNGPPRVLRRQSTRARAMGDGHCFADAAASQETQGFGGHAAGNIGVEVILFPQPGDQHAGRPDLAHGVQ